jgi:hypothetical protein
MREDFFNQGTTREIAATDHGWPGFTRTGHPYTFAGNDGRTGGGFGGPSTVAVDQHRHALIVRDHRNTRGSFAWET